MKRNLILFAALAISVGVLSLVAMALFTDSDQEIYNDLSEMMVTRPLLMADYSQMSCDCLEQRVGEDSTLHEECVDETQTMRSRIGDLDECVIDGLRSLDSPPPAGIESVLECSKEEFGEVRRGMERASEEHEKCSLDFFEATQECQQQLLTIDCSASYDEESKEWMERGSRAFEDCMADGFNGFDGSSLEGAVDDMAAMGRVEIRIDQASMKLDGRLIETLSAGHLDDRDDQAMVPLASLQEELDGHDGDRDEHLYVMHAQGLVPYLTVIRALLTVVESGHGINSFRFDHIAESSYRVGDDRLRPDDETDAPPQASDDDSEPLELAITIGADGFYLSAFGSMLDAVDGCAPSGPTVCLTDDEVDPHALFQEARRAHGEGDEAGAARYYDQALNAYDFRKLYNLLRGLSDDGTERSLRISSDGKLPTGLIHEVMNTAEVQLAEDHYDDGDAFRQARLDGPAKGWLFPDVFFAVHQ